MSVTPLNTVGAATATDRFNTLGNAVAQQKDAAPVFSRGAADQGKLPSLRSLGVEHGAVPSESEVRRALTGDLLRIVRDLRAGDLPKANAKLHEMKGGMPRNFLMNNHIHPVFIANMGRDMLLAPDAKTALGLVLERLESSGISKWHPQFRAAATPEKG